ncbi:MAG: outer membrane protein assembly factor BamA [Spirochaetales bacterium]
MKFHRFLLLATLLAVLVPVGGQTPAASTDAWYLGKPITDIRFEGLVTVARSEIDGVLKPFLGKPFSDELFQELQNALYGLDFFQGLIVPTALKGNEAGSAVVLSFKVQEKALVDEIEFVGNSKLRSADLQAVVTIKKGDMINTDKVATDEAAVLNLYRDKGFLAAKVNSSIQDLSDTRSKVVFQVDEGLQTAVKAIEFKGLSFASDSALLSVMDTKAQSFFDQGLFKEASFVKDLRSIENYYWNRGYIDARVVDTQKTITFDTASERNVLTIVLTVNEGSPWNYGGFTYVGNKIFSTSELNALLRQSSGKTLNKERLEADYQRVIDIYLESGYIFNSVSRKEIREGNTLRYEVTIVERPRAHIENILVRGNTKTHDNVVLRELPVEVGDVFSKSKIITGIRNLYNLQYFSTISPETPQGSADGLMDLILNVEEGKTADIAFGLTFSGSSDFPVSANVKWSDKNFMGTGQTIGVDSTISPVSQNLNLSYNENWLLGQRITLGGQFGFSHTINSKVDQDILGPVYTTGDIPDPYDKTTYVFSADKTYNNVAYAAGQIFPGVPSDSDIATYGLETQYLYDQANGTLKKGAQMQYDSLQFNLGVNTGYSLFTPVGRFSVGTGEKTTLQSIYYDANAYRPANKSLRENLGQWLWSNQIWTKGTWDTRDIVYNPTSGFLASETVTLSGGFLGGSTHYTRFDSRLDGFFKAFSLPVADGWDFDGVFKARVAMSNLLGPVGGTGVLAVQPADELYIDGMMSGRGWGYQNAGKLSFVSGAEFRTPIPYLGSFAWWDTFIDDALLLNVSSSYTSVTDVPLSSHQFSLGTGARIVSPQFPLSLFVTKPFQIDAGGVTWSKGDGLFGDVLDMKLVVAFGMEY